MDKKTRIFTCIVLAEAAIALNGYARTILTLILMILLMTAAILFMLFDLIPKRK
jgi:hypothetical protein